MRTAELEDANEMMSLEVAERRRAEEALREAQRRYRDLVEDLPAVVYSWETNWRDRVEDADEPDSAPYMSPAIEDLVSATCRMNGSRRTSGGRGSIRTTGTGSAPSPTGPPRPASRSQRSTATSRRTAGSSGCWTAPRSGPATHADSPRTFQGVMLDVTARKEAEAKAEAAEERYRQLAEEGPVVSYIYRLRRGGDPPVDLEYMSPQVADLLGYTPAELGADPGRWLELVHPDDLAAVTGALERSWATGEPWALEYRVIRRDGSIGWLRTQSRVVARDDDGRPSRIQGAIMDVTAERITDGRGRGIRAHAPFVGRGDCMGSRGPRYATRPPASSATPTSDRNAWTLLGYTPEELIAEPTHFARIVHPDDREITARPCRATPR